MTRQVALADDAYEQLSQIKRPGESFSDVVRRMVAQERRRMLMGVAGAWKMSDDEAKKIFDPIFAWRKAKGRGSDR